MNETKQEKIAEKDPYDQAKNIECEVDIDTEGKISLDSILDQCGPKQLKEILEILDENSERTQLTDSQITIDNMEADFITSVEIEHIFTSLKSEEEEIVKRWIAKESKACEEDN